MKVLLLNGSPRAEGCTFTALSVIAETLNAEGVETEIFQIGNKPVQDCIACGGCKGKGLCVFDDVVNEFIKKSANADGFVFGTPVYYAHPTGRVLSALDRIFYAGKENFRHKPCAVIASARRAGTTLSLNVMEKYAGITEMPIISSTYWNMAHGNTPEQVLKDEEGMQSMRNIAKNTAWILKCIEAGEKAGITAPENRKDIRTNFIR